MTEMLRRADEENASASARPDKARLQHFCNRALRAGRGRYAVRPGDPDGTPWDGCTRTFLKQAIAALAAEGYELRASFEPEFTLGHKGAEFTPIDESLCYPATGFHLVHDYMIDLVAALNKQGLEVEHYYPDGMKVSGTPAPQAAAPGTRPRVARNAKNVPY
jgi:glutamine synthetase